MTAFRRAIRAYQEQANSKTKLLSLPAELRNAIYQLVLPARIGDIVCIRSRDRVIRPPILRVNRQIRKETASLWYTSVVFTAARLTDIPIALTWMKALPNDAMSLVRNFRVTCFVKCHCEHKNTNGAAGVENLLKIFIRHSSHVLPFNDPRLREHPDDYTEGSDGEVVIACPTVKEVQRRAEAAMDRAVWNEETGEIKREDLLELLKILNDAQVKPLKLCMGRSAWLR